MADQTTLPTCTPGSLGPTKIDRTTVVDPSRDESAAQINLLNACTEELFRRSGLSDGSTPGSYEERVSDLEAGSTEYRFDDFFDNLNPITPGTPDPIHWQRSSLVVLSTDAGGGVKLPLDTTEYIDRGAYLWNREQHPRIWCRVTLDGTPPFFYPLIWFLDSGGTNAWGIGFKPTDNEVVIFNETGGSGVETHLGTFVVDTEFTLFFEVRADGHVWATMDNGTPVDAGAAPPGNMTFRAQTHSGGEAGKFMTVRMLRHRATW